VARWNLAEFDVGPLSVRTTRPLRAYVIAVRNDERHVEELSFEAFTPLLFQRMNLDGSPVSAHGAIGLSDYASAATGHCVEAGQAVHQRGLQDVRPRHRRRRVPR
jgi:hypothetical protein